MSKLLEEKDAEGRTKEIYDEIRKYFGMVPNFFKAQAAEDPEWLELNWRRWKAIMGRHRALDRKTKEMIALTVSLVNRCEYCSLAHEAAALMNGASREEITELKEVVELFESFNSIADSLRIPTDITPEMLDGVDE